MHFHAMHKVLEINVFGVHKAHFKMEFVRWFMGVNREFLQSIRYNKNELLSIQDQ